LVNEIEEEIIINDTENIESGDGGGSAGEENKEEKAEQKDEKQEEKETKEENKEEKTEKTEVKEENKEKQKEDKTEPVIEIPSETTESPASAEQPVSAPAEVPAEIPSAPAETTTGGVIKFFKLTGRIIAITGKVIANSVNEATEGLAGTGKAIFAFTGRVVGDIASSSSYENSTFVIEDVMYANTITVYIERDFTEFNNIIHDNLTKQQSNGENISTNLIADIDFQDVNNDGKISVGDIINLDPSLIIIPATDAEHLDSNRSFISNIYDYIKTLDNNWSEAINESHFARVTFSQALGKNNDITVFARANNYSNETNNFADISIFRQDSDEEIARIENVTGENYYKTYLTGLNESESYDVFDLKIVNSAGECYDNETMIMTENGLKYFYELNGSESVATLNNNTGELEWQLPTAYQEFDNSKLSGEMYKIETINENGDKGDLIVSEKHKVYASGKNNYFELNSLINSSVVYTFIRDCCLRCGSFDQIGQLCFNASAIKSISSLSGIKSDLCKNFEYSLSSLKSTNIANSLNNSLNSFCEILVLEQISSECFFNSDNAYSGEIKSKSWSINIPFVNESFQKNVNNMFVSTTNSIYISPFFFNLSYLPYLEALCNLTDQSIISSSSSKCFINLLTNIEKSTPDSSACLFNSSGILTHISAMKETKNRDYKKLSVEENIGNVMQEKLGGEIGERNEATEDFQITDEQQIITHSQSSLDTDISTDVAHIQTDNRLINDNIYNNEQARSASETTKNKKVNLSDFKLQRISEIYSSIEKGRINATDLVFLDENMKEVRVLGITKENYSGKIYDVDVPNDIILVKRDSVICENFSNINYKNIGNVMQDEGVGAGNKKSENEDDNLISIVMMAEFFKNNDIIFYSKEKNKTSYMDSFEVAQVMPEIFKMHDSSNIHLRNLSYLLLNSSEHGRILFLKFPKNIFDFSYVNLHNDSQRLLNSSIVIALPWGFFEDFINSSTNSFFNGNSSTGCQSILSQNSWSSADKVLDSMNLSNIDCFISLITTLFNNSESIFSLSDLNNSSSMKKSNNKDYLSFSKNEFIDLIKRNSENIGNVMNDKGGKSSKIEGQATERFQTTLTQFNNNNNNNNNMSGSEQISSKIINELNNLYGKQGKDWWINEDKESGKQQVCHKVEGTLIWSGNSNPSNSTIGIEFDYIVDPAQMNLTDNQVLWMHMDNATGYENSTYVYDWSGNNNNGTVYNGTQVCGQTETCPIWNSTGKFSGSWQFDGVNDYVRIPFANSLNFSNGTNPITISAWINPKPQNSGTSRCVVCQGYEIFFRFQPDLNNTQFILNSFNPANDRAESAINSVLINQWTHIAGTYNGSNIIVYINGVQSNSVSPTGTYGGDTSNWGIGATSGGSTPFNGSIDEVRIWNRSMSADEVWAIYNMGAAGGVEISDCTTLDTANQYYFLNQSISNDTITTDCIIISAQNITFDCDGFSISSTQNFTGVYSAQFNTTVKNCNISMGTSTTTDANAQSIGIEIIDAGDNSNIINNTIIGGGMNTGIWIGSENTNISDNLADVSSGVGGDAIYLETASNNNLYRNNGTSNNSFGIYLLTSNNNTLTSNTGISNSSDGIKLRTSLNNTLTSNTGISYFGGVGISLIISSDNNTLINNTGTSNTGQGIQISNSRYNNIINSTGSSNTSYGIYLNIANNNNLMSSTGASNIEAGITFLLSLNNILTNITAIGYLTSDNSRGITLRNSSNNVIVDCINISGVSNDIFSYNLTSGASTNNTFINCSYRTTGAYESIAAGNTLIRKWHYRAYVNDSSGTAVPNANVTAYNVTGTMEFGGLMTNSSGWTNITTITEYVNSGGTRSYYNNYTINATKTGYNTGSKIYNVTASTNNLEHNVNVSLSSGSISNCGTLSSAGTTYTLVDNISNDTISGTHCINIAAANITFDCDGYSINSTQASKNGIYSNQLDTTIKNCNVKMTGTGSDAIEFDTATNGLISNTTAIAVGNGYGIYLLSSLNISVINSTGTGNSNYGIYVSSSNNNTLISVNITSGNNYGFTFYNSNGNLIEDLISISTSQERAIYLTGSKNNLFRNCNLSSLFADIQIEATSTNNTAVNCSYTLSSESVAAGSSLIRKWYYRAYVNDSSGTAVPNANVTAYNVTGDVEFDSLMTNSSGWTNITTITEYVNSGGTRTYYNNYSINVTATGYTNAAKSENITILTNQLSDVLTNNLLATSVINCGTLSTANTTYNMLNSISNDTITTDCIIISAQNITFDCDGYSISSTQNYSGVYSNQFNTTVKNCNISMGSGGNANAIGIEMTDAADYSSVINNTIIGGMDYGISFSPSANGPENSLIENNTINVSVIGVATTGIYLRTSSNNTLRGNNATTLAEYGILLGTFSNNNILINNTGTSNSSVGIYLSSSSNNILTSNTGSSNSNYGIWMDTSSNNTLTSNTATSNTNYAIYLYSSSNNTLTSNTGTSNTSYGIYLLSNSNNNIIKNQIAIGNSSGGYGIAFRNSNNTIIQDCINITGFSGDVLYNVVAEISSNNTFINCTYRTTGTNESVAAGSSLIRKWYYRAYVNDSSGTAVPNANVTAYNVTGTIEFGGLMTNSSGWTNITEITEYVNSGGTRTYYNNYSINTSHSAYTTGTKTYNVSASLNNLNDITTLTDSVIPAVYLISPANNTFSSSAAQYFIANFTDNNALKNATLYIWNSTDSVINNTENQTITGTSNSSNITIVLPYNNNFKWNYYLCDNNGNCVWNNTNFTITFDNIAPVINITYPLNITYNSNISSINYTIIDVNPLRCWYSNSSGIWNSSSVAAGNNFTNVITKEGSNNFNVYCNDSANNFNSTIINFSINTIFPSFSNYWDNNASIFSGGTELALFNVSVQNANGSVWLSINGADYYASNLTLNDYNVSVFGLLNGTYVYNWSAYGNGSLPGLNTSINRYYSVNATADYEVVNCKQLTTANSNYSLIQNINNNTITTDCIIISGQNITLDCAGYSITSVKNYSGVYSNQFNTTVKNCNISMGGGDAVNAEAIGIEFVDSNYSKIMNNTLSGSVYGLVANNSLISDSNISLNDNISVFRNSYFINVSYNISKESVAGAGNTLIRKWYYRANVTDTLNNSILNANISAFNLSNNLEFSMLTASTGLTNITTITEYVNSGGTRSYYSNYTINATKAGYATISNTTYNVSIELNNINHEFHFSANSSATDNCANLTASGVWTLSGNVVQDQDLDCMVISAPNVMLNCNGYSIFSVYNKSGVYSNKYNTTVKNCNISMGGTSGTNSNAIGIEYSTNANNGTIYNNTVTMIVGSGIYLSSASGNNISSNKFTSISLYGILLSSSSNSNILTSNTGTSNSSYAILLDSSSNNTLISNNATSNSSNGILLSSSSNNTLTSNNVISTSGNAMRLSTALNNNLTSNIVTSNSSYAILLDLSSNSNILTFNTGTSNSDYGIYLTSASNNTLTSNTGTSNSSYGIYLLSNSNNNILTNNTASSNSNYVLFIRDSMNNNIINQNSTGYSTGSRGIVFLNGSNNLIQDCINVTGFSGDVLYVTTTSVNNTFINCSYRITGNNETVMAGGSLIRKWWYRAYVNDTNGNPILSANVSAFNLSNNLEFSMLTASTGFTDTTSITEYINSGGTRSYYNNYTINATRSGYSAINRGGAYNITQLTNIINDSFIFNVISGINGTSLGLTTKKIYVNYNENVNLTLNILSSSHSLPISLAWAAITTPNGVNVNVSMNNNSGEVWNGTYTNTGLLGDYPVVYWANLSDGSNLIYGPNIQSNFSIQNTTIRISSVASANTSDTINVQGLIRRTNGTDYWNIVNNLFLMKLNNVTVSSNTYNHSNFTANGYSGTNVNASSIVQLNLSNIGNVTTYSDDYSTTKHTSESYQYNQSNPGYDGTRGVIFSYNHLSGNAIGNITYKFNAIAKFFNASVFAYTGGSETSGGANTSMHYSLDGTTFIILNSTTSNNAVISGNVPVNNYNSFYIRLFSNTNSLSVETPVTSLIVNYTQWEYPSSGNYISPNITLPNVTYTLLKWGRILNGGEIKIQLRESEDGVTWDSWSNNYTNYLTNDISSFTKQYLQYRAWFSTSNLSLTPVLNDVQILYFNASTNSTGGYNYNITIPTNSLGPLPLEVSIVQNSETGIIGLNVTNITIWARTAPQYYTAFNYTGSAANYSVYVNFTRSDTGDLVNGTINVSISNSTGNWSRQCSGSQCAASWIIPGNLAYGNYTVNISTWNESSYYVNSSSGYYVYLEEKNTTGTLYVENKTIVDYNPSQVYNFYWNATLNNTGRASMNNVYVWAADKNANIKNVTEITPCTKIYPNQSCNVLMLITVHSGASSGDKYITWRANWSDNDGGVAGGGNYLQYISYVIISSNANISLSNYSINKTLQHGTSGSVGFSINSIGTDSVVYINTSLISGGLPSSWLSISPNWTDSLSGGTSQSTTLSINVPNQTSHGNYSGIINVSSSNGGERYLNLTINVPENYSWYISPSNNLTYNRTFGLNTAGEIGNYTIFNLGNMNISFNISYSPGRTTDYSVKPGLFSVNNAGGTNPTRLNVSKGGNSTISLYQNSWASSIDDVGLNVKVYNESGVPNTLNFQEAFSITESVPNITYIWFILDNVYGNKAELNKNVTIKLRAIDDVNVNETATTINVTYSSTTVVLNATSLCEGTSGECVGTSGARTVANFSANFTPSSTGTHTVKAVVYDTKSGGGQIFVSSTYTFTSYGTTTLALVQNVSSYTIRDIDLTHGKTFYINYSVNNTGEVYAYSPILNFSGNASINATNYSFSDLASGANTSFVSQINVSAFTIPGEYNLTGTLRWTNPSTSYSTTTAILSINILSNKSFVYSPESLSLGVNSGSQNSTILTINNTGNDLLTGINLSCYSQALCTSFTLSYNETNFNISANNSKQVNITLTVPAGLSGGVYTGVINISERNISRTIEISSTVPSTYSFSVSPISVNSTKAISQAGALEEITISNTGNMNITLNLNSTNSSIIQPNMSSLLVPVLTNKTFIINYTTPASEGSYLEKIMIANSSATINQINVTVNLTATRINITILYPTSALSITNVTAGKTIEIHANVSYGNEIITSNSSFTSTIGGSSCSNINYSFVSALGYWNLTCSAPSLTNGITYNLTLILNHDTYGQISQISSNSIIYRDTMFPSFNFTRNHINKGGNINISINISDNVNIDSVSAVLTYPNSSVINLSLILSNGFYINTSLVLNDFGEHLINISANDTTGNFNSTLEWFEVYDRYIWNIKLLDYNFQAVSGVIINLTRVNLTTNLLSNTTNSSGEASFYVNKRAYDIHALLNTEEVIVKNVNFSNVSISGINFNLHRIASDELAETVELHKTFQGVASNSTNLSNNNIAVIFNYSGLSYDNVNELEIVKCANWNYSNRNCIGSWSVISSSINRDTKQVSGNSTGFSSYFLSEDKCGNGVCESNYGETTLTCSVDCTTSTTTVVSGGGGGGGVTIKQNVSLEGLENLIKNLVNLEGVKVETTSIYKEMFAGETTTVRIKLSNTLTSSAKISLSVDGDVSGMVFIELTDVTLKAGESRSVLIKIVSPKIIELGNYEGDLVLKSGKTEAKIPVTVRIISPEGKLLDVKIQPLMETIAPGEVLKIQTDLINLGKTSKVDVQFDLQLVDINTGEVITRREEAFAIETKISTIKNLTIPEYMETGKYMIKGTAYYSNVEQENMQATSIAYIKVQYPLFSIKFLGVPLWSYAIILGAIAFFISAYFYMIFIGYRKKRFKISVDVSKLPQPSAHSAFIGKVAETGIRSFIDLNKLQMHTLVAGATGGGKTVTAQDIVESALLHNKSVIVFDPTAQWTGFLRKCDDKSMLKRYQYFDMKVNDSRGFNGIIKTIRNPYELINIDKYVGKKGEIVIFNISNLTPKEIEMVVASTIQQIFKSNPEESKELKTLIVYDEVHRLLPKFGGSGEGFVQLERGVREFRKWGIGLVLISQVLSDFVGEIKANIGTEMQMGTKYEGDLERINMKYGEDVLKSVVKAPIGTGMVVNSEYNYGKPYFISFRPLLHSTKRLSNEELKKYEEYFEIVEDLEYQAEKIKEKGVDVLDIELEIKLAKGKVKEGQFQMADMYLETLKPSIEEYWKNLGKTPEHLVKEKISRTEVERGILKAKEERKKFIKENPEKELSFAEKLKELKKESEDKKRKGKDASKIEMKINDLEARLKPFNGKVNEKDAQGINEEIEGLKKELNKL